MTQLLSIRWKMILFMLASQLAIIGCQSGPAIGTPVVTQTGSTPVVTSAVTQTGSIPAATPAVTPAGSIPAVTPVVAGQATKAPGGIDLVFGPGPFNLPATTVGLSDLSRYRESLTLSFEGTQLGQPAKWSRTYVMLASQKPAARQVTIESAGNTAARVFVAAMNGAQYERRGDDACTASVLEKGTSLLESWEPARFLPSVMGAEKAGSETVNGVAANHYTFDERALGALGIAQSKGETWVASDGGYIVRYVLTSKGSAQYFGKGTDGTATWDYELTGIGQPVAIQLPKGCPAGIVDAPLLPDAAGAVSLPGLLTYTTVTSLADAAAFYQKQLPALGWQLAPPPVIAQTTALLDFTRTEQQLSVIIVTGTGGTTVQILVVGQP